MIFIIFFLFSIICTTSTSKVNAIDTLFQQKAITISNDVVGIDTKKYSINSTIFEEDEYMNVLPQQQVQCTFQSIGSKQKIAYTFVNRSLQMIHVLEGSGLPITKESTSFPLQMAKDFLNSYQNYTMNSFYSSLGSMLDTIDIPRNSTNIIGNTQFDVSISPSSTTFKWTYVYNGIQAPVKCVVLSYTNNFLKYFIDNWNLYTIGSTNINLSEKEATDSALATAQDFSWTVGSGNNTFEVKDFNITKAMVWETIFSNSLSADTARNHSPLTLYPMRHVWVSLDKYYFGNVYGIEVFLWADTKELFNTQERFSTMNPSVDIVATYTDVAYTDKVKINNFSPSWIAIPIICVFALSVSALCFGKIQKSHFMFLKKSAIICFFMVSVLFFSSISSVNAVNSSSLIWGSRSSGASEPDPPLYGATWRKTSNELGNQSLTAVDINDAFDDYGDYSGAHNYQGSGSLKSAILGNISNSQSNYPFTAVVDFDHGVGNIVNGAFHYLFEDDNGTFVGDSSMGSDPNAPENGVYDYEVFQRTGNNTEESKVHFAYISTCLSAKIIDWLVEYPQGSGNYYPVGQGTEYTSSGQGLPYAFTHRIVNWKGFQNFTTNNHMSMFGYESDANGTDNGNYCYIGFPYGSAALAQTSIQSGYTGTTYASFVQEFFDYALMYDYSVIDALDEASLMCFTRDFGSSDLYTGFDANWPIYNGTHWVDHFGNDSTLAVYGNGNMHLKLDTYGLSISSSSGGYTSPSTGTYDYTEGSTAYVSAYAYGGYYFDHWNLDGQNAGSSSPKAVTMNSNHSLQAIFSTMTYYLTISSASGGYTSPSSGTYGYSYGQTQYVTVYADSGYTFSYWLLDGQNVGSSNPIGVSMYSDHTLQPVFSPNICNLYVYSGSGGYTSPSSGTYQYSYGQTAYVSAYAYGGYYFDHWHVDGSDAGSSNPIGVSMYSDHSVQPVFSPVTYSLTVSAVNGYGMACSPQVYIDGGYVGNAPVTVYVAAGSHTVWAETFWVYWYLYGFSDGLGNGASRSITSNTNIVAYYGP